METDGHRNRIHARVGSGSGGGNRWRLGMCTATAATKPRPAGGAALRRRRRDYRDLPPVTSPRERMPDPVLGFRAFHGQAMLAAHRSAPASPHRKTLLIKKHVFQTE